MKDREMPVIVGVGQVSEKEFELDSSSPVALMEKAVANSLKDAGLSSDIISCLLYTSPSPRDLSTSRMPSSA